MQFLKKILVSKIFWTILVLGALFYGFYKVKKTIVAGDAAVKDSIPTEVAAQLADPATVEQFRGETGPEGPQGSIGLQGEEGVPGEPGICPDCDGTTATKVPDPASTATATIASAQPQVLVYQPVTVNGKGAGSGKPPTGGGSWTVTNNGGTVINAPVTVN